MGITEKNNEMPAEFMNDLKEKSDDLLHDVKDRSEAFFQDLKSKTEELLNDEKFADMVVIASTKKKSLNDVLKKEDLIAG